MAFNPKEHMTNLKGKDYLEVKWRLVWFRDVHPNGQIGTEIVNFDPPVIRATICNEGGVIIATGHGTATVKSGAVWSGREVEKAETAAIGRALAHAGFGTQFDGEDEDELADSPVERRNGSNSAQKPSNPSATRKPAQAPANGASNVISVDDTWNTVNQNRALEYAKQRGMNADAVREALGVKGAADWTGGYQAAKDAIDAYAATPETLSQVKF